MGQQVMIFFFVLFAFTVIAVDIDLDIPHALRENDECIDEKDSNNGLGGSCASYALQRSSRVKSSLTTDSSAAAPKESEGAQTDHPDEVEIAEAESAKNKEMLKAAEDEEKSDFSSKESLDHEASLNSGASLDPSMSDEPLRDDFSSTANISEEELGGAGPMCAETCWAKYGFVKGDCFCSRHRTWYMWVCSKLKGKRIKTQYGKQYSCSGLIGSGAQCTAKYSHNCMDRRECCDPGFSCYKKSDNWGSCLKTCTPGIHSNEPLKYRTPWSCEVLPTTTTTTTTPPHSPYNIRYVPKNVALTRPSNASLMTFHLYRVQSDEDFPCCANNDMTTLPGALFYLHNEIIWHPKKRSGTFFSIPKTRIVRYKVQTRATQPLYDLGMDFGVMNAFDITQCTGPYKCENFERFGYTPGCENWIKGSPANFPHEQWDDINKYPGAEWAAGAIWTWLELYRRPMQQHRIKSFEKQKQDSKCVTKQIKSERCIIQ
eukprot:TRINITY_DN17703_c0_g1_i2.p1 TRINITY_DN17703_c0_g1~~TRINITY_DN17703_c0_g1_i2.p1  ORF type:complete len:486 (-),score=72.24 TRINITY_DN17703_c0_g1_i2:33-1490(-)